MSTAEGRNTRFYLISFAFLVAVVDLNLRHIEYHKATGHWFWQSPWFADVLESVYTWSTSGLNPLLGTIAMIVLGCFAIGMSLGLALWGGGRLK